jgi:muscleblind protein
MVNMTNLLNGKDSRWLQLEVCREFQRNKCTRVDTECKFAHPPANVEVQNGRVTACYDSIKVSDTSEQLQISICEHTIIKTIPEVNRPLGFA